MKKKLLLIIFCFIMMEGSFAQCGTNVTGVINFCGSGCYGDVTFTSTSGTPPYDLVITGGPTVQYTSSYNWTSICPGIYAYAVTDAAMSCTDNGTVTIVSNPLPVITITPPSASVCIGDSVLLSASGAATYNWSPSFSLNPATGSSVYAMPSATTVYTVVGADVNGCTGSATVVVSVNPNPVLNQPSNPSICYGTSVVMSMSGASTYAWSPATGLSATTGSSVTANPASTTTYTVIGTSIQGCTSSTMFTLTVNPLPGVTFNLTNSSCSTCSDGSITAQAPSAVTYIWSNLSTAPTIGTLLPGTYTVTVADANGCTSSNSATIGVGSCLPAFSVYPNINIQHNYWVVNTSTGAPPLSYLWAWGDATSDTGATPTHTYASEGFYDICLSITDASGCSCMNCWSAALARIDAANTMVTVSVVPSIPTGNEESAEGDFVLHPNPVTNQLVVSSWQLAINEIEIYDAVGQIIKHLTPCPSPAGEGSASVDVSVLANGIYFVRVRTKDGIKTQKIIVQH